MDGTARVLWSRPGPVVAAILSPDGTHLAIVDSTAEITGVMGLVPGQNVWLGTTDRLVIGTFRHVTGATPTFLPWDTSEPDATALECVYSDSVTMKLSDQGCTSGRRYVCECDGVPADTASY